MTTSTQTNTTPFPWEQWAQLPKVEREAEMKEAAKQFAKGDQDEIAYAQLDQAEPLTGETAGNSDEKYIPPFPYWDETINESGMDGLRESGMDGLVSPLMNQAEAATDTEAVGYPKGLFPLPNFSDQSANVDEQWDENVGQMYNRVTGTGGTIVSESWYNGEKVSDQLADADEQQNAQVDAVTGYSYNKDDAVGFDWFQMHHDDGIMDGYLDTAENANGGWMTAEPIAEITGFLLGQATAFEESGMDGLVVASPFGSVTLNEPQYNNVF